MERISLGGRPAAGFALGQPIGSSDSGGVSPTYAAVMTGAAAGLLVYVLRAPTWGAVLAGAGTALVTKVGIERAAA